MYLTKTIFDPDVIRTRSLLIWSQTRYHCATESDERNCENLNLYKKNITSLVVKFLLFYKKGCCELKAIFANKQA